MKFCCAGNLVDLAGKTHIMGIVNCTPDSFYPGSRQFTVEQAVVAGMQMAEDGADFLDVGGESSRPGADPVSGQEELDRVIPVVEGFVKNDLPVPISIDTRKSLVATAALAAGAQIVNDISALKFSEDMAGVIAASGASVILMHMRGKPKDMQVKPVYDDLVKEVSCFLVKQAESAQEAGIARNRIVLDPGIGFGKSVQDNYELIRELAGFKQLGYPILVGASRKSFIGHTLNLPPDKCLEGTLAIHTLAILNGANILRVHDVKAAVRAAQVADHYMKNNG